jgi:ferredoxin--NADP+ reductase
MLKFYFMLLKSFSFFAMLQGTNNLSFTNKSWTGTALACGSKAAAQRRHARKVHCMAVQQSSKSKVSVVPLDLESAKEPPLNTYKPKGPYTATIVSVERAVGPNAPGETCHVVIDHGGNVPYWEGQSYGIIPPVSVLVLSTILSVVSCALLNTESIDSSCC